MTTDKRRKRRQRQFEQSVPLVLGQRTAVQPLTVRGDLVLAVVGVLALLGLTIWFALSPLFHIADAQVIGVSRVAAGDVFAASGLAQRHVILANGRAAEANILAQLPALKEAQVSCFLPADCVISVVEWEPLLTWDTGAGLVWVDGAGSVSNADRVMEGRWLVNGPLPTDERGLVERDVLLGIAELTGLGVGPGMVSYRSGRGLVLQDPAGWRVIVGQGTGMEERLQVYAEIRDHLLANDIRPTFVDVRFPSAPYYSETNEW